MGLLPRGSTAARRALPSFALADIQVELQRISELLEDEDGEAEEDEEGDL
jgi:hypothetical protein